MVEAGQLQIAHTGETQLGQRVMSQDEIAHGIYLARRPPVVNRNVHLRARIAIPRDQNTVNLRVVKRRPATENALDEFGVLYAFNRGSHT